MGLTVDLISSMDDISQEDIDTWNNLAANPFQRWEWLGSWWDAYQKNHLLHVLSVKRDDETIAFAPWFLEKRIGSGRTIQFLGSGKVCTDHLSLLVRQEHTHEVCEAIAEWLWDVSTENRRQLPRERVWEAIELVGVDKTDQPINCLARSMEQVGLAVEQTEGMGCYVIDLPAAWEDYVSMRSKSGRREIRQSQKNIDDGTIVVHHVRDQRELTEFWDPFVRLHQRRRHDAGTTGCFDHEPFENFLRTAAMRLLDAGLLEFIVASIDGNPVAAQFAVADNDCWYFYQSGMEPDAAGRRPGLSLFCHTIRQTIESGRKRFDMLRGDEPYKLRWRAELQPAQEVRVCSPRAVAQIRNQVYNMGLTLKSIVKSGIRLSHS